MQTGYGPPTKQRFTSASLKRLSTGGVIWASDRQQPGSDGTSVITLMMLLPGSASSRRSHEHSATWQLLAGAILRSGRPGAKQELQTQGRCRTLAFPREGIHRTRGL